MLLLLLSIGLFFGFYFTTFAYRNIAILAAIPIGAILWEFGCITLLLFKMPLTLATCTLTSLLVAATLGIFLNGRALAARGLVSWISEWKNSLIPVIILVIILCIAVYFPKVIISLDSLIIEYMGYLVSEGGASLDELGKWYSWGWPLMLPFVSFSFDSAQLKSFTTLPLAASLSAIALVLYSAFNGLRNARYSFVACIITSALVTLYIFSPEISVYNIPYVNHHSLMSVYLFVFALALSREILDEKNKYEVAMLVVIAVIGVVMARHEGGFISIPMLLLFAERFRSNPDWVLNVVSACVCIILIYLYYLLNNGFTTPGTILSETIILMMMGGHIAVVVLLFVQRRCRSLQPVLHYQFEILLGFLIIVQVLGMIFNSDIYFESIINLVSNLFAGKGWWGNAWYVLVPVYFISALLVKRLTIEHKLIAIVVLMVMSMPAVRDMPFRVGIGDSANRMFLHLLPISSLLIVNMLANIRYKKYVINKAG